MTILYFCSNYGGYLESALYKAGWSTTDVNKVKIWNSGYPKEPNYVSRAKGYCYQTFADIVL